MARIDDHFCLCEATPIGSREIRVNSGNGVSQPATSARHALGRREGFSVETRIARIATNFRVLYRIGRKEISERFATLPARPSVAAKIRARKSPLRPQTRLVSYRNPCHHLTSPGDSR